MTALVTPQRFRFPTPTDENLPALARLAFDVSATQCKACRNYHLMWPYLRSIGACGGGPDANWQQQIEILARAAAGRPHVRWLIAGAADAGLLAMAAAVMHALPGTTFEVTVVDRCPTPLALCRAYAEAKGIALTTIASELEDFEADGGFEMVLMHRTIAFVAEARRAAFLAHAARWLAPGGRLVMALVFDTPGDPPRRRPNRAVLEWRAERIREAIANGELEAPEDAETFVGRVTQTRISAREPLAHRREDYDAAFAAAKLVVDERVLLRPDEDDSLVKEWERTDRFMLTASRSPA